MAGAAFWRRDERQSSWSADVTQVARELFSRRQYHSGASASIGVMTERTEAYANAEGLSELGRT